MCDIIPSSAGHFVMEVKTIDKHFIHLSINLSLSLLIPGKLEADAVNKGWGTME